MIFFGDYRTGRVPQPKRREEIRRFKNDPECRLFLSTDSGSVGLNLQVADVVINLDMPWNPARLEQRIARAWRKHQKRPARVINLVSEHSIEHRMLSLLEQKRTLAEGVVDGKGKNEMSLPSGRAAFLERIDALMAGETPARQTLPADPLDRLPDAPDGSPRRVSAWPAVNTNDGWRTYLPKAVFLRRRSYRCRRRWRRRSRP